MNEVIKTNEVIFRKDLYPRFNPDQGLIQRYSESLEYLPPIILNQNKILVDGFHRWKAHQLAKVDEIKVVFKEIESEKELRKLAFQYNSHHGKQLTNDEKKSYAQEMIGEQMSVEELSILLSVDKSTVNRWTTLQRENQKKQRDNKILELYLNCHTQDQIAEEMGVPQQTIARILTHLVQISEMGKDFTPFLYNIWNTPKGDSDNSHFGAFPKIFMENLLYYHTEKFDIIYDPFAGGGTTVDVCKKWLRRYYCSDLTVKPGREDDIKQWDITKGLPDDLPKPDMVFLDPPYWKQAEGKYSKLDSDFGNMSLEDFYKEMGELLKSFIDKNIKTIAIVIQPTQYSNNMIFEDHIFKFNEMISEKYNIEMRYIIPYSTQQYIPQIVNKAKELTKCLGLNRDLVIWRKIDS